MAPRALSRQPSAAPVDPAPRPLASSEPKLSREPKSAREPKVVRKPPAPSPKARPKKPAATIAEAKPAPAKPAPAKAAPAKTKAAAPKAARPAAKAKSEPTARKPASVARKRAFPKTAPGADASRAEARAKHAQASGEQAENKGPKDGGPNAERPETDGAGKADSENPFLTPEVERFAANMARLWEESGRAMSAYLRPREKGTKPAAPGAEEVVDVVKTLGQVAERWMAEPKRAAEAQAAFAGGFLELWAGTLRRFSGEETAPIVTPDPKDARFKDPEWTEHPVFDFLKQAYLHASQWADRMVADAHDLDPHTRHKASFYVKLLSNAVSPSNFVPTNPELIRETLQSKGENLVRGMRMFAEDIAAGKGDLRIRQTDFANFEVGRNLATTPGKVVFRNELFELLQYAPATEMARTRPLMIVPPWINKFYILDLTPEKSLIKWAVEQGLTVFCISWVNPDERHAAKSFDDYMRDGVLKGVDVVREICGVPQVDAAGYCVGGTLLSMALAYLAAKGDDRIASATLMTAQVDFTRAGDLRVFVDEDQIAAVEARMAEHGYLEGGRMANAFNMLRPNDLIWPYVVNTYLKGKAPFPFDLLYWNADATRMPAANHSFYLRRCYLNNDFARGALDMFGEHLDLANITVPVYSVATREDHIAPAVSVFLGAQRFAGPVRFVLAGSGHIAGVVNHPKRMKYQYWTGEAPAGELEEWLSAAEEKPGSWWPDWRAWLAASDATMVAARIPGEGPYPALEDAPGSYVKVKS